MFTIPDRSFKRFENYTVKVSTKETKWTSLEVRTHPTFLKTLISKYDFRPVKLPELSRNGSQEAIIRDGDHKSWDPRAHMIWDNFSIFGTRISKREFGFIN